MDMRHQIDYPQLEDDIVRVLDTLQPYDREVRDKQGRWFLARVLSYRTLDDHIAGVVLTLVDITEGKAAEDAMRTSEEKLSAFVKATSETVYEMNADWSEMRYLEGKKFIASIENPRSDWMIHYISGERPCGRMGSHQAGNRCSQPLRTGTSRYPSRWHARLDVFSCHSAAE